MCGNALTAFLRWLNLRIFKRVADELVTVVEIGS